MLRRTSAPRSFSAPPWGRRTTRVETEWKKTGVSCALNVYHQEFCFFFWGGELQGRVNCNGLRQLPGSLSDQSPYSAPNSVSPSQRNGERLFSKGPHMTSRVHAAGNPCRNQPMAGSKAHKETRSTTRPWSCCFGTKRCLKEKKLLLLFPDIPRAEFTQFGTNAKIHPIRQTRRRRPPRGGPL